MSKKVSSKTFSQCKNEGKKLTLLTAYDYSTAKYLDESGVDGILVGDSLAMVALGYETTHSVSMEEMKIFTSAVARGVSRAMVIADMPFMSTSISISEGVRNAGELIKAGAQAVKIEGGDDYTVELVERLRTAGISVVSHLGFTPQFLHVLGGYNVQGKSREHTEQILEQAQRLEKAGAFAIVLEMMPEESAEYITRRLSVPTIGIGAGRHCDGQILVSDDVLGKYSDFTPKFSKQYADMRSIISKAAKNYVNDVQSGKFPAKEHVFSLGAEEKDKQ